MSMKRIGVFALVVLLIGIGASAVTTGLAGLRPGSIAEVKAAGSSTLPGAQGNQVVSSQNWVRSNSEGSVLVEMEVLNPGTIAKDREIDLRMYMTTHSGDLTALDLGKLIEVSIDGTSLGAPTKWAWNQASSHHPVVDISVKLPDGVQKVGRLALVLKDVGGVKERRFEWDLNAAALDS